MIDAAEKEGKITSGKVAARQDTPVAVLRQSSAGMPLPWRAC